MVTWLLLIMVTTARNEAIQVLVSNMHLARRQRRKKQLNNLMIAWKHVFVELICLDNLSLTQSFNCKKKNLRNHLLFLSQNYFHDLGEFGRWSRKLVFWIGFSLHENENEVFWNSYTFCAIDKFLLCGSFWLFLLLICVLCK